MRKILGKLVAKIKQNRPIKTEGLSFTRPGRKWKIRS